MHVHSKESRHVRRVAHPLEKIIKLAKELGIGLSITDHDKIKKISDQIELAEKYEVDLIPGAEFCWSYITQNNIRIEGEILAYGINPSNQELIEIEEKMEKSREKRDLDLIPKLEQEGIDISVEKVREFIEDEEGIEEEGVIVRKDIVDYLIIKGHAKDKKNAYDIIKPFGHSLVHREKTPLEKLTKSIAAAGGTPVLAHVGIIINDYHL